jgi:hypothetical protein
MTRKATRDALARLAPTPVNTGQILFLNLPGSRFFHSRWENHYETL